MVPVGALAEIEPSLGPTAISLYNLFPSATINGAPAANSNSGQALSCSGIDRAKNFAGRGKL